MKFFVLYYTLHMLICIRVLTPVCKRNARCRGECRWSQFCWTSYLGRLEAFSCCGKNGLDSVHKNIMMLLLKIKTFLFPPQRRQNRPLQDPPAVCCSCRNVLHSKGYQFLAAVIVRTIRRCANISQECWSSGSTTCLLLKPLWSGCGGQNSASERFYLLLLH